MDHESKQKRLVLEYLNQSNLETIIKNSIRSLIQVNKVPDNPFGAMYRHFTYFSAKEDTRKAQEKVKSSDLKTLEQAGLFSITSQEKELECFGLAHLLHYINPNHFKVLSKTLKELCVEHKRRFDVGPYNLEVRVSIGGGEIFKSTLVPHPEVSPTPLEIRAECIVEGPKFENAFTIFSDYVYDDIMRIGSNNALNLVRDFCIEQGPGSSYVKRLSLQQMQHNKQLLINELKNATIQKRHSYIRILVFSQDLERYSPKDLIRAVTPSRLLSVTEPSVFDHFQFISTKKCYILHYTATGNPLDFNSLSPVPCFSLYSSLFPNPDSARHYAKIFYNENENPYDIPAIEEYLQWRRDKMVKYYKSGKLHKMAWETLQMALTVKNHLSNYAIVSEILSLFTHPSSKLFKIVRQCKALEILINSFYDSGFEHLKKLAEGLFVRVKEECWSAFGNASTAEMLLLKPMIIRMMDCISVNNSRTLKISPNTLRIIEKVKNICASLGKCNLELFIRLLPALSDGIQRILHSYNIKPPLTFAQYTDKKQTELAFDIDQELKNQNLKRESEHIVVFEYLVKTGVIEILILTTRDLVMSYPLIPNPLKTYAAKLLEALFKYEMFQFTVTEVMEKHMHVPNEVSDGVFVHSNPDNIYSMADLPYIAGSEEVLLVSAWQEIGFFKTIVKEYEFDTAVFNSVMPKGYTMQSVFSVCGTSVINNEALTKFPSLWTVYNDIFITGPSFNAASHTFFNLLVQYALWIDNSTNGIAVGFFSPFSTEPLASFKDLVTTTDRQNSIGLLLSAYQMNSRVWLRFIIPYTGQENFGVVGIPIAVNVYFNMHFRVNFNRKITSLVPIVTLEDIIKVFFSREDFEMWRELSRTFEFGFKENLLNEFNASSNEGKHYRATVCLLFFKLIEKDKELVAKLLRVNETPLQSLIEASMFAKNLEDLLEAGKNGHRKNNLNLNLDYTNKFSRYLEATMYQERNVLLENSQMSVLRVSEKLVEAVKNPNGPKYTKALASLKYIYADLQCAKLVASLAIHNVLESKIETSL